MTKSDAREQKARIRKVFGKDELRRMFRERAEDEMFEQIGRGLIGPIRAAALRSIGLGHVVIWTGFEYLTDSVRLEV